MKYVFLLISILFITPVMAQDWGEMQPIGWDAGPPFGPPGVYNPSYCDEDSILYFDGYLRFGVNQGGIWASNLDSLDQYGQRKWSDPVALPEPINLPQEPEIINAMASITESGDSLFFCSDRQGTYGGLDIWISVKQDESWSDSVNLGDMVNSELDEQSPHSVSSINTLFFDRLEQRIGYHFGLYKSLYLGDNVWQSAERLPEIINPLDYGGFAPFFDVFNSKLDC